MADCPLESKDQTAEMDKSAPRGTSNSGGSASRNASRNTSRNSSANGSLDNNSSLAQTTSDPANTAGMEGQSLNLTLFIRTEDGRRRFCNIVHREPHPSTQLASRNQAGFGTRMSNSGNGAQSELFALVHSPRRSNIGTDYNAEIQRAFYNDANGAAGFSSFGSKRINS